MYSAHCHSTLVPTDRNNVKHGKDLTTFGLIFLSMNASLIKV